MKTFMRVLAAVLAYFKKAPLDQRHFLHVDELPYGRYRRLISGPDHYSSRLYMVRRVDGVEECHAPVFPVKNYRGLPQEFEVSLLDGRKALIS